MYSTKLRKRIQGVLGVFRPTFMRSCLRGDPREVRRWYRKGRPAPAPAPVKRKILQAYAHFYQPPVFIETGTYQGDTPYALRDDFEQLFTIELSRELFLAAQNRLAHFKQIKQLQGDSSAALGEILPAINRPCMFWLDGHYSGGVTAQGKKDCPLLEELAHIFNHPVKQHIILLDDARHFGTKPDYPSVDELVQLGRAAGYESELHYDILCLTPVGAEKLGRKLPQIIA